VVSDFLLGRPSRERDLVVLTVGKMAGATAISGSLQSPWSANRAPGALELMARNRTIHLQVWPKFLHPSAKCLQGAELRVTIQMVPNLLTKR